MAYLSRMDRHPKLPSLSSIPHLEPRTDPDQSQRHKKCACLSLTDAADGGEISIPSKEFERYTSLFCNVALKRHFVQLLNQLRNEGHSVCMITSQMSFSFTEEVPDPGTGHRRQDSPSIYMYARYRNGSRLRLMPFADTKKTDLRVLGNVLHCTVLQIHRKSRETHARGNAF